MKKIPLETTVAGAYRFLFTNIVSIIGTVWLPYVLLFGFLAGCIYLILPHGVYHGDFSQLDRSILWSPWLILARGLAGIMGLIAAAMITVNLMRHSLGLKQTTTFVYFSLAAPVWRFVGAILLAAIVLAIVALLLVLIGVLFGFLVMPHMPHAAGVAILVLLCIALACAFIYGSVRLCFFIPAVVVAEERIALGRSWQLGGGNFWRIVVVWLLIAIPVWFIIGIVMQATILPIVMSEASRLPHHPTPDELKPLFHALLTALPIVLPVALIGGIAIRALMAGAMGTAYNAITEKPAEDPKASA